MAFRFRRSIKVIPGVRLNFSKSGMSTSIGGKGGTVNLSARGIRTTVGIPGSGISWSKHTGWAGNLNLNPTVELRKLADLLTKLTRKFNILSPKTNKISESWNKSVGNFIGGRGPSLAKFETLSKRYITADTNYQKIIFEIDGQAELLVAIRSRVQGFNFGLFGGEAKRCRSELIAIIADHQTQAPSLKDAIAQVRNEISVEFASAQKMIP